MALNLEISQLQTLLEAVRESLNRLLALAGEGSAPSL